MRVVARISATYKGNSGAKTQPRRITTKPTLTRTSKPVAKRKTKRIKIKGLGATLGYTKPTKKASPRKPLQRKRSPSK
jgi:hypothetical protein